MKIRTLTIAGLTAVALAGCAGTPAAEDDGRVHIVASTSVWGDLAASIGGDLVTVTSLIDAASQDPHSFEASARDQLAIADADLVIENGGGYDSFMDTLIEASGSTATVVNAVDASELLDADLDEEHGESGTHDEGEEAHADDDEAHADEDGHDHIEGFNEHVWYSLHGTIHVVEAIEGTLAQLDAANAGSYEQGAAALIQDLEALESRADDLSAQIGGGDVAVTEPVPVYLLEAVGLHNETPAEFTEAIEEGNDVPPLALQQTLDLLGSGDVRLLAYNGQTASPETERVRSAAEEAGVPVVEFAETLPDGQTYLSWMTSNLDAIEAALTQ